MGYSTEPKISKKRYVELRKLSDELYDWLKLHKVDYGKGECCVLKDLTLDLLKRD